MIRSFHAPVRGLLPLLCLLLGGCALLRRPLPEPDRTQDPRIRAEVEARLSREPSLDRDAIRVEVDGGIVLLHGRVEGIGAWRCAITNAELVSGVQTVVDYLVLARGPREVTCLAPRGEARDAPQGRDPRAAAR